jgi:hypothetical protein
LDAPDYTLFFFGGALPCDIIVQKKSGRWNCMEGISAASGGSAAQDVQLAVQYSVMKQVTDLQKDMLSQLMQSMGRGQNIDLLA